MNSFVLMIAAVALLASPGCSRSGFQESPTSTDQLAREGSSASDLGRDQRRSADLGSPQLACATAVQAGPTPPPELSELALLPGGLQLVGAIRSQEFAISTRPALDQPFGAWLSTPYLGSDPTYFTHQGVDRLIVSRDLGSALPRRLELCDPKGLCQAMVIRDARGIVTADLDGPSVAVVGGQVLMAHNIGLGGYLTADLYLATPEDLTDLSKPWVTSPVNAVNQPSWKEDDPALSPDGLVLVFSALDLADDEELWVSERGSLADPFGAPRLLAELNSTGPEAAPCFGPLPGSGGSSRFELFFVSTRDGQRLVYRSECTR